MKTQLLLFVLALGFACATSRTGLAQDKPQRPGDIAKDFNAAVMPINDQIESLYKKANDPKLSMDAAAQIINQQSALRGQADGLFKRTESAIDGSFRRTRDAIVGYNARNQQLGFQSAVAGSTVNLLNNLAKYPAKDDFEKNKDQMSQEWEAAFGSRLKPFGEEFATMKDGILREMRDKYGVEAMLLNGYARIGTSNPYTGEVYYKYYGPDGKLNWIQWEPDANALEKLRQDAEAYRRRQLDEQANVGQEATAFNGLRDRYLTTTDSVGRRMNSLAGEVRRVDFAGNWGGYDNDNNWVRLRLYRGGSMSYAFGKSQSRTDYSSAGVWEQTGKRITMKTNDGEWKFESRITQAFRLQFTETRKDGRRWTNYLSR